MSAEVPGAGGPVRGRTRRGWSARSPLAMRTFGVVLVVTILPLVGVWVSDVSDRNVGTTMLREVEQLVSEAVEPGADRALLALRAQARVRVVRPDGTVAEDHDLSESHSLTRGLGGLFFGPDGAPTLAEHDAAQAPLLQRPLLRAAQAGRPGSACEPSAEGTLLVCTAAAAGPDGVVLAEVSSRRAIRALYDLRYQLLKLLLIVAPIGLFLGGSLYVAIVRSLGRLRREVRERTSSGSLAPIAVAADDEIGDLARDINTLLARIAARDAANEAFAADLVHEAKNPVAAVRAAAEALEGPLDAARVERLRRALRTSADRLERLTSELLDLARAEAGLTADERAEVDLGALARAMAPDGAEVRVAGEVVITAVPERVEAVLRNLLDNALAWRRSRVAITVTGLEEAVELVVADDGPGVPPEELPRVFERFYSRRPGGTGLGLALARAIVVAHGGSLSAANGARVEGSASTSSAAGLSGARFTAIFPRSRP